MHNKYTIQTINDFQTSVHTTKLLSNLKSITISEDKLKRTI
jgi:hypothetical protein